MIQKASRLTKKEPSIFKQVFLRTSCVRKRSAGFSAAEVILAGALLSLIITAFAGIQLYGYEAKIRASLRARAIMLAEEGLEAVRNIRDENFSNLTDGTFGLASFGGVWTFSGSRDMTEIYERNIIIASIDADRKTVRAIVSWAQNPQRTGSVTLTTRFTNWKKDQAAGPPVCQNQAASLSLDVSTVALGAGNRELQNVFIANSNPACDIVLDKITPTWTNALRSIERIQIAGKIMWKGSAVSGDELDIKDLILQNSDGQLEAKFRFGGNMKGNIFGLTLKMSDGTVRTVSGIAP